MRDNGFFCFVDGVSRFLCDSDSFGHYKKIRSDSIDKKLSVRVCPSGAFLFARMTFNLRVVAVSLIFNDCFNG